MVRRGNVVDNVGGEGNGGGSGEEANMRESVENWERCVTGGESGKGGTRWIWGEWVVEKKGGNKGTCGKQLETDKTFVPGP